jgi:hypothetical protein
MLLQRTVGMIAIKPPEAGRRIPRAYREAPQPEF